MGRMWSSRLLVWGVSDFMDNIIVDAPPAALAEQPAAAHAVAADAPKLKSRQSNRLLARPSSVPVSRRATHRLLCQLGLVDSEQAVGDAAMLQYEQMYQRPSYLHFPTFGWCLWRHSSGLGCRSFFSCTCRFG
jgi:hypothetical protein